jgi:hypothetical protein
MLGCSKPSTLLGWIKTEPNSPSEKDYKNNEGLICTDIFRPFDWYFTGLSAYGIFWPHAYQAMEYLSCIHIWSNCDVMMVQSIPLEAAGILRSPTLWHFLGKYSHCTREIRYLV